MTTKERLDELATNTGLYGGDDIPPNQKSIARARRWLRWLPRGYIYPDVQGGIRWEYDLNNWSVSIEFDNRGRVNVSLVEIH